MCLRISICILSQNDWSCYTCCITALEQDTENKDDFLVTPVARENLDSIPRNVIGSSMNKETVTTIATYSKMEEDMETAISNTCYSIAAALMDA